MGRPQRDLEEHNRLQRNYFEQVAKPNMVPRVTPYLNRHVDEALRFAMVSPAERVLEVGCGMGRYTLLLASRGVQVEGLDLSPILLERMRAYNDGRFHIRLHCADISSPPPELEGSFDCVLGFFVLHHLGDLEGCFAAVARVLRPGGRVVFLEPNAYNPLFYLQILLTPGMTWAGDGGIARMRRNVLYSALSRPGIVRLADARFGFFPPLLANTGWGAALESRVERVRALDPVLPFQLIGAERPSDDH